MKVLASVYACSPYDGSERAVGWNWIHELSRYHQITAITCHVYRRDIEDYIQKHPGEMDNTKFVYVDVPRTGWHVNYKGERLYYILWQKEAEKIARKLALEEQYDLLHHITYVTCILPTYMHKVGLPFLYGPVSGGENIPSNIHYPLKGKEFITEKIRTLSQIFFQLTPNYHKTMKHAAMILTTTEDTKSMIPSKFRHKVDVFQAISLKESASYQHQSKRAANTVKFLMAGRMLYWKGFELGIRAFIKAIESGCDAELTILGDTENDSAQEAYKKNLMRIVGGYLDKKVHFVSKVSYEEMGEFYDGFDALLNCSLRDSGCLVVMEAMSRGLPVICVDSGGPKVNTTKDNAIKIVPDEFEIMKDRIADAICLLSKDNSVRNQMSLAARNYANNTFTIEKKVNQMNDYYALVRGG